MSLVTYERTLHLINEAPAVSDRVCTRGDLLEITISNKIIFLPTHILSSKHTFLAAFVI